MRTTERLPARPECVSAARQVVLGALLSAGCRQESLDTARLLVSELASNVVRHSSSREMTVAVDADGGVARVTVSDDDGRTVVLPAERGHGAESGRGLFLVAELSMRWGIEPRPGDGKGVWFEVAC